MKKALNALKKTNIIIAIIGFILGLLSKDLICSMFWIIILLKEIQINRLENRLSRSISLVDEDNKLLFTLRTAPPNDVDEKPSKN